MANSKAISIRVPDELLGKIDQLAEEKYKSHKGTPNRSLVVLDAIVAYFDALPSTSSSETIISVSDSVTIADFNELQGIVITLSDTVRQLQEEIISLSDNVKQLNKPTQDSEVPIETQLSINSVSDTVSIVDSIELQDTESLTLSGKELAERLKISPSKLSPERKKGLESFVEWTKSCEGNLDGTGWGFKGKPNVKGVIYYLIKESPA